MVRLGAVRHDDDEVVRVGEQRVARDIARAERGGDVVGQRRAVVIQHRHREAVRAAPRDRLADPAHAEDAERRAVDVAAGKQIDAPLRPFAAAQEPFALADPTRGGHQQREAEVGGRLGEHARRVADRDAARGARGDVDVVVADGEAADRAQLRTRIEQRGVDRLRAGDEDAGLAVQARDHLFARPDVVGVVALDVEVLAQVRHRLREDTTADQDRGSHGAVRAINTAVSQSRKRTKPATGSRSVTSVFSIAPGSAQPSDMPQTSCSFAGAPISSVTMR